MGKWYMCLCFGCGGVVWVVLDGSGWAAWARVWLGWGVMSVCVVSLDYLC